MFVVEKAKQERQEKIVQAEGEAEAAKMISLPPVCIPSVSLTMLCWFH